MNDFIHHNMIDIWMKDFISYDINVKEKKRCLQQKLISGWDRWTLRGEFQLPPKHGCKTYRTQFHHNTRANRDFLSVTFRINDTYKILFGWGILRSALLNQIWTMCSAHIIKILNFGINLLIIGVSLDHFFYKI